MAKKDVHAHAGLSRKRSNMSVHEQTMDLT